MKRKIVSIAVVLGLLVGLMVVPAQAAPTATVQHFYITAGGTSGPIPDGPGLVQRLDGDGSGLTTLVSLGSASRPRGITIDPVNSHLYWNDWGTGLTQRSNLDGSNVVTIISHARGGLNDIAVDPLGGKLYVSLAGASWPFHGVKQYNLDGSGVVTIWDALSNPFAGSGWFIDGVGLDTVNGHVYFADIGILASAGGPHGVIRTDLNGANPVSLVTHLDGRGRGMAIDPVGAKMYFAQHSPLSAASGQIWRANLDGTSLEVIVTGLERPRDVALDLAGNKVYWVDESTGLLQGANLDGSGLHTVAAGLLAPDSLAISPIIQVDIDIKPWSDPNSINTRSKKGVVPVAILGSDTFDVTKVDVTTVTFGPAMATPKHDLTDPLTYADHLVVPYLYDPNPDPLVTGDEYWRTANMDLIPDLVFHFPQMDTGLAPGDTEGTLKGELINGMLFEGVDAVRIVK